MDFKKESYLSEPLLYITQLPILRLESLDFRGIEPSSSYSFISKKEKIFKCYFS